MYRLVQKVSGAKREQVLRFGVLLITKMYTHPQKSKHTSDIPSKLSQFLWDLQDRLGCYRDHTLRLLPNLGTSRELAVVEGLEVEDRDNCEVPSAPLSISSFGSSFVRGGARSECR